MNADAQSLFDLTGSTALVTGGAGVLGTWISRALGNAGAHVVIASRDLQSCVRTADELRRAGLSTSASEYDQSKEPSILTLRDRVIAAHGSVDILVNNAVSRPMKRFEDSIQAWRESMEVNAGGLFSLTRAFLEPMMARGRGSVINIGSIQSVAGPDFSNYEDSSMTTPPDYHFHKHGLIGLTKYLAAVAGPRGVRVNALCPGAFDNDRLGATFRNRYCRRVYLGRLARYEEIMGAVVFLASQASSYVTGQVLILDGGYTS